MTTLSLVPSSIQMMVSKEIAKLTNKEHAHVLRDIRAMISQVYDLKDNPSLDYLEVQGVTVERDPHTKRTACIYLDKDHTLTLLTGYDAKARFRVMKRWQELESGQSAPKITDPTLAALVQTVVELDQVKQQQAALARQTEMLENRVQNVELQHRSGVPDGYLSKKQAHHLHGVGLSDEVFHLAMARIGVTSKSYIHRGEDGYDVPSIAYKDDEVAPAVEMFLDDAVQDTPKFCKSPMLNGKRFKHCKEEMAA